MFAIWLPTNAIGAAMPLRDYLTAKNKAPSMSSQLDDYIRKSLDNVMLSRVIGSEIDDLEKLYLSDTGYRDEEAAESPFDDPAVAAFFADMEELNRKSVLLLAALAKLMAALMKNGRDEFVEVVHDALTEYQTFEDVMKDFEGPQKQEE
ncbi:hypothetical protein AJ80_09696 [Polytolypa hystricis UAMH7299]|uniref:Uncharacterized protein n=1 Tax=Polytolypa hystricis (strain UAMH7299) TaxID=1447883 RepID=A0A2B7WLU6_POLH7|nr:hypothetical protein AJ80_09696 [Polytolypa hystricis UAMH7299]